MDIGDKYGRLTIIEYLGTNKNFQKYFLCECECGKIKRIMGQHLKNGNIKSCGCITKKHGMSNTRFYRLWKGAKARCNNISHKDYSRYGGAGVMFLWNSFDNFMDDMYVSYIEHIKKYGEQNTSIDRINGNGNYCKENCRWATNVIQSRNRVATIIYNGKSLREWCNILGIKYHTAWNRIKIQGKDIKDVLGFNNN